MRLLDQPDDLALVGNDLHPRHGRCCHFDAWRRRPEARLRAEPGLRGVYAGATADATISVARRGEPSAASHERVWRRPSTRTGSPLRSERAALSASSCQATTEWNWVSRVSLVATRIRQTALPVVVWRSSGSATSLPASCTRLIERKASFAAGVSCGE